MRVDAHDKMLCNGKSHRNSPIKLLGTIEYFNQPIFVPTSFNFTRGFFLMSRKLPQRWHDVIFKGHNGKSMTTDTQYNFLWGIDITIIYKHIKEISPSIQNLFVLEDFDSLHYL